MTVPSHNIRVLPWLQFLSAFMNCCLPSLWYCNTQHSTKACQFLYLFRVTFDFTAASRSKSWVVSVFSCLTSHYCMLMSVSDTVSLRMWHSTSLLLRHIFDISYDSRRYFLRLQKRFRNKHCHTDMHITHKSSVRTSQKTHCVSVTNTDQQFFLYAWVRASWFEFNNCPTRCDLFSLLYFCTIHMNQFQLNNESGW